MKVIDFETMDSQQKKTLITVISNFAKLQGGPQKNVVINQPDYRKEKKKSFLFFENRRTLNQIIIGFHLRTNTP